MFSSYDIIRINPKDKSKFDYTEKAFSHQFNPYDLKDDSGNSVDYIKHIQDNINNFVGPNAVDSDIAKNIALSSYKDTSTLRVLHSEASWNKVNRIIKGRSGSGFKQFEEL
jgi:hypothetical protein